MEFIKYKAIKGYYGGKEEINVTVPKEIKFLYKENSIGHGLNNGHNHYMFFIKVNDITENELDILLDSYGFELLNHYILNDVHVFTINNVKFIDKIPVYESYNIPMIEFGLNDMYILHRTKDTWPSKTIDEIIDGKLSMVEIGKKIIPGNIFAVSKILAIEGPYDITTFDVTCGTYFDDRELYSMNVINNVEMNQITENDDWWFSNKRYRLIATKDATEFERIKNKVLEQITNYKV